MDINKKWFNKEALLDKAKVETSWESDLSLIEGIPKNVLEILMEETKKRLDEQKYAFKSIQSRSDVFLRYFLTVIILLVSFIIRSYINNDYSFVLVVSIFTLINFLWSLGAFYKNFYKYYVHVSGWSPCDIEILNEKKEMDSKPYNYIVKKLFDSYQHKILENKKTLEIRSERLNKCFARVALLPLFILLGTLLYYFRC